MNEVEVKATRSFEHVLGRFTRGRTYRVDLNHKLVPGLIDEGYFIPTEVLGDGAVDTSGIDAFLGSGVGVGVDRPAPGQGSEGLTDGQGETGQDTD